jgi:hypothetical protein
MHSQPFGANRKQVLATMQGHDLVGIFSKPDDGA